MKSIFQRWREALLADRPTDLFKILLVVAHPDDEVIGATSVIRSGLDVQIVHTTDGSPEDLKDARAAGCSCRTEYAELRRRELAEALGLVRGVPTPLHELEFADQSCSYDLAGLTEAVRGPLEEVRPDLVITHPYEGGHPDHDATAFAVHTALRTARTGQPVPLLVEMTSYHMGSAGIETGKFLPCPATEEFAIELSPEARALKAAMLACFRSQHQTLQYFGTRQERFRIAPAYDFTQPPHPGTLFYEQFDWGVKGAAWRHMACGALGPSHAAPLPPMAPETSFALCH